MAPTRKFENDEGYYSSEERNLSVVKRQKTEHGTNVPQDSSNSDMKIAELCFLFSDLTLKDAPQPPPILIVTNDMDTPSLLEKRLARAVRIGTDANLAEINRFAGEQDVHYGLKPPRAWPQFIHPLWQSKKAMANGFRKPNWLHPFLNRSRHYPEELLKHL